jgi:uncharacterized protein (TIGR03790 family)
MRFLVLAAAAVVFGGCGDEPSVERDAAPEDSGPLTCPVTDVQVTGAAHPGEDLMLMAVTDGSGPFTLQWQVSDGTLIPASGNPVRWHIPSSFEAPGTISWTLTVGGANCDPFEGEVEVTLALRLRTLVIYDPGQPGSEDVARAYADMRDVPDTHLCPVTSSNPVSIPAAEYPSFVDAVTACAADVATDVRYLVPVWGVPYKVQGRINDLAGGGKVETSLDALLVFGADSKDFGAAVENPLYREGDSPTGKYDGYLPADELIDGLGHPYFLVARIDGASRGAALNLVDRTAVADDAAAKCALAGTVYVDGNRGVPHPHPDTDVFGSYESGEWNIIGVETVFAERAPDLTVVADYNDAEFGIAPAPLEAPDALYYAGWYSYRNYNDVFTWNVGAIGGHLDSCSACDIRGDVDWSAVALRRGITATFGAVNEPYVAGMPEYDQFFLYLLQGATFGEAAYESTRVSAWMMVWVGDPLYRPYGHPCG